jgi:hypothetical protein
MYYRFAVALVAIGCVLTPGAHAHGIVGSRLFISTMLIDDPNVADEATVPLFFWLPQPNTGGGPAATQSQLDFEYDKRITENFGFALNDGYTWLRQPGEKTANGWQNLELTLKWKPYINVEHEFMMSVGIVRDFARSGAYGENGATIGNDATGSTAPTIYFGKGFGDLPISYLRPLAITGELGYAIADKKLKVIDSAGDFNNGEPNQWSGGLSLQYSMIYLASQVRDFGFPDWVNQLTPTVEMSWSSSASRPSDANTQYLFGVGVNYTATTWATAVELLIPGNKATGSNIGVVAQFHIYLDDMFPNGIGKPLLSWFTERGTTE